MDATTPAVDVQAIVTGITSNLEIFSTDNLLVFLGAGVAIAGGLVLTWFGYRYISRKAMGALKKGRL